VTRRRESLPSHPAPERAPLPLDPSALPPLASAFDETLAAGLDDLSLALDGSQLAAIHGYVRLLLAWTSAINLTAIREPAAVAREHILDSLAAVPLLRSRGAHRLLDIGSGGGLPGLPIAIAMPEAHVLLVESIGKKASFLATAARGVGLAERVRVAAERAELLSVPGRERDVNDAVVVRAVAPLPELVELAFPLIHIGGVLIAWKREPLPVDLDRGRDPFETELVAGRNAARALQGEMIVEPVPVEGLRHHRLVVVTKTRPTPNRFPRPPAERRAHPL
jgi:16S rRNA (guanine527-N7)-methyltransferase